MIKIALKNYDQSLHLLMSRLWRLEDFVGPVTWRLRILFGAPWIMAEVVHLEKARHEQKEAMDGDSTGGRHGTTWGGPSRTRWDHIGSKMYRVSWSRERERDIYIYIYMCVSVCNFFVYIYIYTYIITDTYLHLCMCVWECVLIHGSRSEGPYRDC